MNRISRISCIAVVAGLLLGTGLWAEETSKSERQRGFFFEVQVGQAACWYGDALDAVVTQARSMGLSRLRLGLGLNAGYALSRDMYFTGGFMGYGDRLYGSSGYIQMFTYMGEVGIRYYPLTTGFLIGLHAGIGGTTAASDFLSPPSPSPGFGFGALLAYEFSGFTGIGIELGVRVDYCTMEGGGPFTGEFAFIGFSWK